MGGRCWSLRGFFSDGIVAEHGGAFINTDHTHIRELAHELGLTMEVAGGGDLPVGEDIYWFDDEPYTVAEATADWRTIGRDVFRRRRRDSAPAACSSDRAVAVRG